MQNCIGLIYGGAENYDFGSLCRTRPAYMLPFGGRYRILDFILSDMTSHTLSNVVLYGGRMMRSTLDHVGSGKPWELNRRRNGLTIFPPVYDRTLEVYSEISSYFDTLSFFKKAKEEYVYFADPMVITKEDLYDIYDRFVQDNYDIMLLYKKQNDSSGKYINTRKLILNPQTNEFINIGLNLGTEDEFNLYPNIGFMKKQVFIDLVTDATEKGNASTLRQAIINNKNKLRIGTAQIACHVEIIRDLKSFYDANMNLLNPDIYNELFFQGDPILTKSKDEPSVLYGQNSKISNSLIANGCIIKGQVENSIIFRGVTIGENAIVKNSVVFQDSVIGDDSVVVNVVMDRGVNLFSGVSLVGSQTNPYVVEKSVVIER